MSNRVFSRRSFSLAFVAGLLILSNVLSACSAIGPLISPPTPTATATETPLPTATPTTEPSPTPTTAPTNTPEPTATETAVALPTETFTPVPTETATPTITPPAVAFKDAIWIYYIEIGTGGPDGCGDTAVAFSIGLPKTGDVEADLTNALSRLLAYHGVEWGEYYNALGYSVLSLTSVDFDSRTGNVIVELGGAYDTSRDKCDNARVKAQVFKTVRQFKEIKGTDIRLNGNSFGDRVSNDK